MRSLKFLSLFLIFVSGSVFASSFKSQEEIANWVTYYYVKPEPERVVDAVKYLGEAKLLKSGSMPSLFGFLAGVFRSNPQKVNAWVDQLSTLADEEFSSVLMGLWYADLPFSKEKIKAAVAQRPALKTSFSFVENGQPMPVTEMPLEQGTWVLDSLWGNFMATGTDEPVIRMMKALPWIDVKGDINRLMVGGAARWSMTSNAAQHKRVLEICTQQAKSQPKDIAQRLEQIIENAKKVEENQK
jgi:hypothetical protein